MTFEMIMEAVATLGFPIVCVGALGFFVWQIYKQSVKREETLMAEITENRLVNQQFAELIGKYDVKLEAIQNDVKDIKDTLNHSNI